MKKLILFILLFPVLAWAGPGYMVFDSNAVPAAGCSTPTGDVMYESFGDDSTACTSGGTEACINTWTINGDSQTFKESLPGSPPSGSCTYGLLSDTVDAAENAERIYIDMGDPISYETSTDVVFSLYVDSTTTIDNNQNLAFMTIGANNAGTSSYCVSIRLWNASGTLKLYIYGSTQASATISTNTWYKVKVHLDGTAESSYFQVDDGGQTNFTRYDANKEFLVLGSVTNENDGESLKFYLGYVYVDNP